MPDDKTHATHGVPPAVPALPIWPVVAPALAGMLAVAIELAWRQLTRTSLLVAVAGASAGQGMLMLVTAGIAGAAMAAMARRRRRGHPRAADALIVLILASALNAGLVAQGSLGARLQSDGFYYYAYLRSIWFDRDLDFTNDYRLLGLGDKPHLFEPTPTGYAQSAWTIGPALVWSPFFGLGHVAALGLAASGREIALDGTAAPYRQAIAVSGLVFGLIGTFFTYRLVRLVHPPALAIAAACAVVAGSFQLWYLVKEPTMTHAPSMAAVALLAWRWMATRGSRTWPQWAALGLVAGFAGTIRWQNVLFALMPAVEAAFLLVAAWRARDRVAAGRVVAYSLVFTGAAAAGFLPQMIAWKAIYGSWLAVSPLGPEIRWWSPQIVDILWSSRNGLFSWSPVLYLAAVGTIAFAWRDRRAGVPILAAIAAMIWFNASIQDWWGSASFGMRRFDGVLPLLAVGLATALTAVRRWVVARPGLVGAALVAALVLWNAALVSVVTSGRAAAGEATSFGGLAAAQVETLHGWFGYPFSYPWNVVFSAVSGLSPARFDRLRPSRFLGDPARPYGRIDLGPGDDDWLLDGWHGVEREGPVTFRWTTAEAGLVIPLDRPAALTVQVRVRPFTVPAWPAQQVTVAIGGRRFGPFPLQPGWQDLSVDTPREAWRRGVNRVAIASAYGARPADVGLGADTRVLGVAIDWVRVRIVAPPAAAVPPGDSGRDDLHATQSSGQGAPIRTPSPPHITAPSGNP